MGSYCVIEDTEIYFMAIIYGNRFSLESWGANTLERYCYRMGSQLTGNLLLIRPAQLKRDLLPANIILQHSIRSIVYLPLIISNQVIGTLTVASRKPDAYNSRHLKLLEQLASQIAMPIENARLYAKTERMARVDSLTGLLNRRSLDEILPSEIGRHSRYGGIFS